MTYILSSDAYFITYLVHARHGSMLKLNVKISFEGKVLDAKSEVIGIQS